MRYLSAIKAKLKRRVYSIISMQKSKTENFDPFDENQLSPYIKPTTLSLFYRTHTIFFLSYQSTSPHPTEFLYCKFLE